MNGWTGVGWMALAGSTCGAGLIALSGGSHAKDGATLAGDLLVVVSLLIALFWILINKELMGRHSHVVVTAYGVLIGTAMLMVWVPLRYGMPPVAGVSLKAWLALAASGVLCTATTTLLWNWGLTQVPASQAGVPVEYGAADGELAGCAGAGRAARAKCLGRGRIDSGVCGDVDDAVEDPGAGADDADLAYPTASQSA